MMNALSRHRPALLLALLVGTMTFGIVWFGVQSVPGYAGIYKQIPDDQNYYLARVHDVIDGHPFLTNPYFAEHKTGEPVQVWLGDYVLAKPLALLHVSVPAGFLGYTLLFVAVLFFLTYLLVAEVTSSYFVGILGAFSLTEGVFAVTFLRSPSPQFNFVFWLLTGLFMFRFLRTRRKADLAGALLSFGALFYLYPYFWTYWTIVLGLLIVIDFLLLRTRTYRSLLLILLGGALLGIFYFLSALGASRLPFYQETMLRIGLVSSHVPSGIAIVAVALGTLLVLGLTLYTRRVPWNIQTALLGSGTLAALIAVNQHVITGQNMEFSSHYMLPSFFWCGLVGIYCVKAWVNSFSSFTLRRVGMTVCIGSVVLVAGWGMGHVAKAALAHTSYDSNEQRYAPVFTWLTANTKTDDVVFANDDISSLIPVYTPDNVYSSGYGILFFLSNEEGETRDIINHYWDTFSSEYIITNQHRIFGAGYLDADAHTKSENTLRRLVGLPNVAPIGIPAEARLRVEREAREIQSHPFSTVLKRYHADYLVWDSTLDPQWRIDQLRSFTRVYGANGISVYHVD